MEKDFLTDVPSDSPIVDPLTFDLPDKSADKQVEDEPAESSAEKSSTEGAPSQKGADNDGEDSEETASSNTSDEKTDPSIPLNKDKRWKEKLQEIERLRVANEQLIASQSDLRSRLESLEKIKTDVASTPSSKIPKLFSDVYGDGAKEAWEDFRAEQQAELSAREASLRKQIREELESEKRTQAEEQARWSGWVNESVAKIEETHNVSLADENERNKFLQYVVKYKPTDQEGNIDFMLGWEMYNEHVELQRLKDSKKVDARKRIAGTTTASSKSGDATPKPKASNIRNKDFFQIAMEAMRGSSE